MTRRTTLDRRTFLKGVLGGAAVSIAIPPLAAMLDTHGIAYAGGHPIPKRFGVFFWGNGVRLDRWVPSTTGRGWAPSEALVPLSPVLDYVSVVSGMEVKTSFTTPHQAGAAGMLSGAPLLDRSRIAGGPESTFALPSIDQVIAREIGQRTRFVSLEAGVSRRASTFGGTTLRYLSHNGPDSGNPAEHSPHALFDRIFGPVFQPPGAPAGADPRGSLRRSVLDAVAEDAATLRARLGVADRQRLEEHLESVRALERTLGTIPSTASCGSVTDPGDFPEIDGREPLEEVSTAMSDLLILALACDQTRVVSLRFNSGMDGMVVWPVGTTEGMHSLTHEEPGDQPTVHRCVVYIMERFAYLLAAMRRVTIGGGNLLDHTCVLATSDVAEGDRHSLRDYPILVAGGAGGALRPGEHHRSTTNESTSKVLLTIAQAMGLERRGIGAGPGYTEETVASLLA